MKTMSKILASSVLGALVAVAGCAGSVDGSPITEQPTYTPAATPPPSTPATPSVGARRFVILHTNDEHSHLFGYGPESQYPWLPKLDGNGKLDAVATVTAAKTAVATGSDTSTVGGIVRRQYLVNKLRSELQDPVLLVSAGDSMMGTLMHLAAPTAAPDQLSMALLGYDFMTVGNHDFDWGAEAFAATLATAKTLTFGGSVPVVASNMKFGDVQAPTDSGYLLKTMVGAAGSGAPIVPYAIKTLSNGLRVGVMGMMGYDAYLVTAAPGKVRFSVPTTGPACDASNPCAAGTDCKLGHCVSSLDIPGHLQAEWNDAQATADALRAAKVDVVVLLSHLGIDEDMLLAQHTKGIDVIIGGHSHTEVRPIVVSSDTKGKSIIVQAGNYGRLLGELAVTVAADGAVSFDAAASDLHAVDHTLDAEIAADDAAVEEAMSLSGGVLAPVMAGLNGQLGPKLGLPGNNLWGTMLLSTHDVLGEVSMADTNLSHFVTDAMYGTVTAAGATCPMASRLVVVEANGVLRDSLNFGNPLAGGKKTASAADIFRVSPLGASASDQTQPGYGVTMFNLVAAELYAGMDIGTTKGRQSDSFFLSYAGAQVTYDPAGTPFDKTMAATDPNAVHGTILKIAFGNDVAGYDDVIYERAPGAPWASGWKVPPTTTLVTVVTNAYIAGFLQAFGFTPRDKTGTPIVSADPTNSLAGLMLCVVTPAVAPDCAGTGAATIRRCAEGANHAPPWTSGFTELREWGLLMKYAGALQAGGGITDVMYSGDNPNVPAQPRVSRVLVSP